MHRDTHEALAKFVAQEVPGLAQVRQDLVFWSTAPDMEPGFPRTHHTGGRREEEVRSRVIQARLAFLNDNVQLAAGHLGIAFHWIADDFCPSASPVHGDPAAHAQFEVHCAACTDRALAELRGVGGLQRPRTKWETLSVVSWVFCEIRASSSSACEALNKVARTCVCIAAAVCQSKRCKALDEYINRLADAARRKLDCIKQERERALLGMEIREVQIRRTKRLWWLFAPLRRWWNSWRVNFVARTAAIQTRREYQAEFDSVTAPHKDWYLFDVSLRNI